MKKKDTTPFNKDEKERQSIHPERVDPEKEQETFTFSADQEKAIVEMVMEDYRTAKIVQDEWKKLREKDQQQINCEPPSKIENLEKLSWQSDRNLGLLPGVLDTYQATLLATCFNPDTIFYKPTKKNTVNNRDNLEKFTKWAVGPAEMNVEPEVDDFIANQVGLGCGFFRVFWKVWYEWVDRRIPITEEDKKTGKRRTVGYKTVTERRRFEKGVIENIDNLDDFLVPAYGKHIQSLPFCILVLHLYIADIVDMEKRKIIRTKLVAKTKPNKAPPAMAAMPEQAAGDNSLRDQKARSLGITEHVGVNEKNFPLDVYEWQGWYEHTVGKGEKAEVRREKWRFYVEPTTETFLGGCPLRKVQRTGKYTFAGGPFRKIPGQLRGGSLTRLVSPVTDALNNNYNQTSDYQTIQNLPFGFANLDEGFTQSSADLQPGKIYPVSGKPEESVYFPNLQRSLAWSAQDKQFLLEMVERLTGAASYFLTSKTPDTTATRDNIVAQKGETRFGIWVRRLQSYIVEAIDMAMTLYQDLAPPDLAERVLGDDGKSLIRNLSIESLRGNYEPSMVPDLTSGSKAFERQVMLWASQTLSQGCPWMDPRLNPRGNWLMWKETMYRQGIENPEQYLPPMPTVNANEDQEAKDEWARFMEGEDFDPPEGVTPAVVRHYMTHLKQKETQYQDLPEEHRAAFDNHFFKTAYNFKKFMQGIVKDQQAMQMAMGMTEMFEKMGLKPPATQQPPAALPAPAAQPQPSPFQPTEQLQPAGEE